MQNDLFSISSDEIFQKLVINSDVMNAEIMSKIFNHNMELYFVSKQLNIPNRNAIVECKSHLSSNDQINPIEPFEVKTKISHLKPDSFLFEYEMILKKDKSNIGTGEFKIQIPNTSEN